jgi:CDP-paratose 2-epimerase
MQKQILVTGGAGFVGSNLVHSLLDEGFNVTLFDALLRQGSLDNLAWLKNHPHQSRLRVINADVRDHEEVQAAVRNIDIIYHLAGQVAVTSSVSDPRVDFEINALGTLNVLEAARLSERRPAVIFTSTNKVYGGMEDIAVVEETHRYRFQDLPGGVSEDRKLDFHSPYGCSKGAADQYIRDYARIYKIPTVVFRMSCIYGPRQFGTEDQGWVAYFIIAALTGKPITIYGDGKQVRDILFVDDLVRAFRLAGDNIEKVSGEIFNIGGGPANTLSVWGEVGEILSRMKGGNIPVSFDDWRPGDQPCYVTDIRKIEKVLGWQPRIDVEQGIGRLWDWVSSNRNLFGASEEGREERQRLAS